MSKYINGKLLAEFINTKANYLFHSKDRNMKDFKKELEALINSYSKENGSDTPDFILAEYLTDCLTAFDRSVNMRNKWYKV